MENTIKVICFHSPGEPNDYLSNWYYSYFTINGIRFSCVEQYMMFRKAMQFGDVQVANAIMKTSSFAEMKRLGRMVQGYRDEVWASVRYNIVKEGVMAKFCQNPNLAEKLLSTEDNLLAECAVRDTIWGIGLSMRNPDRLDPKKWRGSNFLGKILMEVREQLRNL